jgi:hypothetical protein
MLCQTALACAKYIEMSLRTELDQGAADFSGVSREGTVVIVEYDLKSVRSDFFNGEVEDGRTLEKWGEDELVVPLRADACRELDHRDFVRMGGRVIHRYRFSDGEVFREVVIDRCQ